MSRLDAIKDEVMKAEKQNNDLFDKMMAAAVECCELAKDGRKSDVSRVVSASLANGHMLSLLVMQNVIIRNRLALVCELLEAKGAAGGGEGGG